MAVFRKLDIFEPVPGGVLNVSECLRSEVIAFPRPRELVTFLTWRSMEALGEWIKGLLPSLTTPLTSAQKQRALTNTAGGAFYPSLWLFFISEFSLYAKIYSPKLSQSSLERGNSCCCCWKIAWRTLSSEPTICLVRCCSCFASGIQWIQTDRCTTWTALRMNNTWSI